MNNKTYLLTMMTAVATLTGCGSDMTCDVTTPDGEKSDIRLSMSGDNEGMTVSPTRAGFTLETGIVMRIKSEDGATGVRYTRTQATAGVHHRDAVSSELLLHSDVKFTSEQRRYWDDAYGRSGKVSVFAIAIADRNGVLPVETMKDGEGASSNSNVSTWGSCADNTVVWTMKNGYADGDCQTLATIGGSDLVYSNNIKDGGEKGRYRYDFSNNKYVPDLKELITGGNDFANGRMEFQEIDPVIHLGEFDMGHMHFHRAMTRLTVELKEGAGFNKGVTTDFQFTQAQGDSYTTTIKLLNAPYSGTLNVETGTWATTNTGDILRMADISSTASGDANGTYQAQILPGKTFGTTNDPTLTFTIDNNTYYITEKMVFDALSANDANKNAEYGYDTENKDKFTMQPGKNYKLKLNVNKTEMLDMTATLVDWVDVNAADVNLENAYISLELMDPTSTACDHFDLYRADADFDHIYTDQNGVTKPTLTNWEGNYTEKATLSDMGSGVWSTNWFWESNKAFYHLRTVDKEMRIQGKGDATDDYIDVFSGPINDTWETERNSTAVNDKKFNDYHWGAPMKSGVSNMSYDTDNGYAAHIYPAIGSTQSQINIIEQHMMANVHIVIHTGEKSDHTSMTDAKVTLKDGSNKATRVTLTNFIGNGKVDLGNGLVTASGTKISSDIPVPGLTPDYGSGNTLKTLTGSTSYYDTDGTVTKAYSYRVVPQSLYNGSGDPASDATLSNFVGLTIQTPDFNEYYLRQFHGIVANEVTTTHGKTEQPKDAPITYWYPGHDYTYHIYINKKAIDHITCTVADWVRVVAEGKDLDLED